MMRPTIALCCIAKNEGNHVKRFLDTFSPLVDKVYFVDTGSTDNTLEIAKQYPNVETHFFEWIDDFAAARNYAFSKATEDYIMWADLDDSISNQDAFTEWRDKSMHMAEMWFANYRYAFDKEGNATCTFGRERVVKNNGNFEWKYTIHEGILPKKAPKASSVASWTIDHLRTEEDLIKDKRRNLNIFDKLSEMGGLDARMKYYFGKELFENREPKKAATVLLDACKESDLESHDRILCIQYACYALMQTEQFDKAIDIALTGLQLAPNRAEYFIMIADCYVKKGCIKEAIPYYHAAKNSDPTGQISDDKSIGAVFQHKEAYTTYPRNQLARLYFHLGQFKESKDQAREALMIKPNPESDAILAEVSRIQEEMDYSKAFETTDIVFTCLGGLYEWDMNIYKNKGIGGSETACVEMADWIKTLSPERHVIVFNTPREEDTTINGVEYKPLKEMYKYFKENKPALHVAWRHAQKFTEAKTIHWAHDLVVPGMGRDNSNTVVALSEFHKTFIASYQNIPYDRIYVGKNGINPDKLPEKTEKNPFKIVYSSSPDRELDRVIMCLDIVRLTHPVELHVFYGIENMKKMGKQKEAEYFMKLINDRPWIKYHGNVSQETLYQELKDTALWVYVPTFQETFCITALEMVAMGVYPIVNKVGALPNTLKEFIDQDMCTVVDTECQDIQGFNLVSDAVKKAIETKAWERVKMDKEKYSWESVCREWIRDFIEK